MKRKSLFSSVGIIFSLCLLLQISGCRKSLPEQVKKGKAKTQALRGGRVNPVIDLDAVFDKLPATIVYNLADSINLYIDSAQWIYLERHLLVRIPTTTDRHSWIYVTQDYTTPDITNVYAVRFFDEAGSSDTSFTGRQLWINLQDWHAYGVQYTKNKITAVLEPQKLADMQWETCLLENGYLYLNGEGKIEVRPREEGLSARSLPDEGCGGMIQNPGRSIWDIIGSLFGDVFGGLGSGTGNGSGSNFPGGYGSTGPDIWLPPGIIGDPPVGGGSNGDPGPVPPNNPPGTAMFEHPNSGSLFASINNPGSLSVPDWLVGSAFGQGQTSLLVENPDVLFVRMVLGLNAQQTTWLAQNLDKTAAIKTYLLTYDPSVNFNDKKERAREHLNHLINDNDYRTFVNNYMQNNTGMWWRNEVWLEPLGGLNFGTWAIEHFVQNPSLPFKTFKNWFLELPEYTGGEPEVNPNYITFDEIVPQAPLPALNNIINNWPKLGTPGNYTQMPSTSVYQLIGGSPYANHQAGHPAYQNACAMRGSRALLYSGIHIPVIKYGTNQRTEKGSDNKNYILDAVSFNKFMLEKFGDTPYKLEGAAANNPQQVANLLGNKNGIYVIVNNSNAAGYSGHVDLILNGNCPGGALTRPNGGVKSIRIWQLN